MIRCTMVHARLLLPRSYVCQARRDKFYCQLRVSISSNTSRALPIRLLLMPVQAKAGSCWPLVSDKLPPLAHGRPYYQMCTRGPDEIKMSSRRLCHGSPENQGLAKKSCVPCNSKDIHAMSEDSAKKLLEQVSGWELTTEGDILKLHKSWKVKNFVKGLEFFQLVAAIAEEEGHHPDLHLVGWNNVRIDVWTHSVRGLTDNDFILAAKINDLKLEVLLSKKPTSQK